MNLPRTVQRLSCVVAGFGLFAASCGGPGNDGRTKFDAGPNQGGPWLSTIDPTLVQQVPWLNGVQPAIGVGNEVIIPSVPMYPPIGQGLPDPGSQRADCTRVTPDLEFARPTTTTPRKNGWFDTFEPEPIEDPAQVGVAAGWSSYDDLTQYAFHVPGDATWYPGLKGIFGAGWGMPSDKIEGPGCEGVPDHWALRFKGGLFRKWGGGISHAFSDPPPGPCPGGAANADFCPPDPAPGATTDSAGIPLKAASGMDYLQSHGFIDVSTYEGVAFWARRGPEGQDYAFLILTDKFTSGRLARENQTFCRRVRECHTRCLNGAPCSPDDPTSANPIMRCYDPSKGPVPTVEIDSLRDLLFPRCGKSACTSPSTYADPDFDGKECRPYTFPAADESGEYCWNAGDPPPPSRDDRCQDGWQVVLQLSPDWKFYTVPFSELRQGGFGKRAPYLDLKSIDTIAFGSNLGFADAYFNNVTFYRRKK